MALAHLVVPECKVALTHLIVPEGKVVLSQHADAEARREGGV